MISLSVPQRQKRNCGQRASALLIAVENLISAVGSDRSVGFRCDPSMRRSPWLSAVSWLDTWTYGRSGIWYVGAKGIREGSSLMEDD
jgi:hypothetical protein